jgi:chemotaxis protein MotB
MVVQFVLRETITGQESELDTLSGEISALAQALGLEKRQNQTLAEQLGEMNATLNATQTRLTEQQTTINTLTATRDRQAAELTDAGARIASFEEQVAGLLADRRQAQAQVAELEGARQSLTEERDALNLALATARDEVDAQTEAARLAAARRDALDALVADLRAQNADVTSQVGALSERVAELGTALSDEEAQRLADAEAAAVLRRRLEDASSELTSMTLAIEEQRAQAEETLTLLAAARKAEADLDVRLAAALVEGADRAARVATLEDQLDAFQGVDGQLSDAEARLAEALVQAQQAETDLRAAQSLGQEQGADIADLRRQLAAAQAQLAGQTDDTRSLEQQLAAALAAQISVESDAAAVRERLTAALAARRAAEAEAEQALTQSETRAALLSTAREALNAEEARATEAQKQTELLNQQVAAMRDQLSTLQGLLDESRDSDSAAQMQLENLGSALNTALARVAAEERRRRQLEEAERRRLEAQTQDLERYRSEFFGRLRDVLGAQDGVRIEGDRFVFSSEVLFPPGSATLSVAGRNEVAKVADILKSVADAIPEGIDWVIRVDGHTDDVPLSGFGAFADNWELSQARALSVVRYMIDFLGIPPGRLAANGFGQYQPVDPADTPEARAQNRRIELKFTEK